MKGFLLPASTLFLTFTVNTTAGRDDHDIIYHDCVKAAKVKIWREALRHFSSVLYVDDTVIVARNSPDIFRIVGKGNLGVVGERGSRTDEETDAFKRVICYRYGCFDGPFLKDPAKRALLDRLDFFNSGVVVFDQVRGGEGAK